MLAIDKDHIFTWNVPEKLSILIELNTEMKSETVIVRANNADRLKVLCESRDDAAEVAAMLARNLFVPIE